MNEHLLLRLPHRQFVFTLPKVLRGFFRHDRRLHGEISRLIFRLLRDFSSAAAGRPIRCAAVLVFQSAGEFVRWNPHWHGLFLEGGFDRQGRFVHLPAIDLPKMSSCFRQRVTAFFLERKLLNERLAKSMIQWTHSGFSVDASVRIPAGSSATRQALSQYIVRPPLSLQKLLVDEGRDAVVCRAPYSDYFRTDSKIFAPTAFLAEVLQHLPDSRNRLIRCYGLYSSRARGTWSRIPYLLRHTPEGWQRDHAPLPAAHSGQLLHHEYGHVLEVIAGLTFVHITTLSDADRQRLLSLSWDGDNAGIHQWVLGSFMTGKYRDMNWAARYPAHLGQEEFDAMMKLNQTSASGGAGVGGEGGKGTVNKE